MSINDTISRQAAIDIERRATIDTNPEHFEGHQKFVKFMDDADISNFGRWQWSNGFNTALTAVGIDLKSLPSAQPERDIPIKPIETTDRAWGIPHRQAVCPKRDYYLGNVAFLGDHKGKRITYCETCGQAIDWEGWDFDE